MGHSRRFRDVDCESALPPRTDIVSSTDDVGKVPLATSRFSLNMKKLRTEAALLEAR